MIVRAPSEQSLVTWRPAAASFRNLVLVGVAAGGASAAVMAASRPLLALVAVTLGLVAGLVVMVFISARRLAHAEQPALANWPGPERERRRLARAGLLKGINAAVVALILGATSGLVPAVGVAFAGAGTAAAVTAWFMRRAVVRYETEHTVTVFAARGAMQRRAVHRFGTA
jgi:hypothetical protein